MFKLALKEVCSPKSFYETYKQMPPAYQTAFSKFQAMEKETRKKLLSRLEAGNVDEMFAEDFVDYPELVLIWQELANIMEKSVHSKLPPKPKKFLLLCYLSLITSKGFKREVEELIEKEREQKRKELEEWQEEKQKRLEEAHLLYLQDKLKKEGVIGKENKVVAVEETTKVAITN